MNVIPERIIFKGEESETIFKDQESFYGTDKSSRNVGRALPLNADRNENARYPKTNCRR